MSPSRRLQVFAVEPDTAQVTWGRLGPGPVRIRGGSTELDLETDGGPGAIDIRGLTPGTTQSIEVGNRRLTVRTPKAPPGAELFRLASLSDLHLGLDNFGVNNTMREPDAEELHTLRCTRAALAEAKVWGAQHLVLQGDVTERATPDQYDLVGKVVAEWGLPTDAIPGNHEAKRYRTVDHTVGFAQAGLEVAEDLRALDLPGIRLVLIDSTRPDRHRGHTDHVLDGIPAALDGRPSLVLLHHNLLRLPVTHFWPPGVPGPEANRFLDAVAAAAPAAVVASGHTHRHRTRRRGNVVVTETGSPKDYPGTWTGYVVHEGGIRQVVRRISRPDCIAWTEYTRWAALGVWGHWSPGTLAQRCFTLDWPA